MKSPAYKSVSKNKNAENNSLWHRLVVKEKLNNALGFVVLLTVALLFSIAISSNGKDSTILLVGLVIGVPLLFGALFNLQFGIILVVLVAFFVNWVKKFLPVNSPLGLSMDILIAVMFFGMFIKQIRVRDWSFMKNPISVAILVWIGYNLLMFANPEAASREAWFYTVRAMAFFIVLYYIAVFAFSSLRVMEMVIFFCVGLTVLAALYGLFQEFVGLPGFEESWLASDPRLVKLVKQGGRIRVFSFLSDPSNFGILLAYMGMFCFVLVTGPFNGVAKFALVVSGFIMIVTMIFTGTRTAFVLLPAGFVFFAILTLNRYVMATIPFFILTVIALMVMPFSTNPLIYRVQTAFKIKENASMNTRLRNQAEIQPYIWSHPIGGGLGSTGYYGKRFTPDTKLANFPPDSGYVRVAVEMGWIGLLIYCGLLFVIFKTGIQNYVNSRSDKIRTYYVAFLVCVFAMIVSNYPQDSITMLPTSIIFYLSLAALVRLKDFDSSLKSAKAKPETSQSFI